MRRYSRIFDLTTSFYYTEDRETKLILSKNVLLNGLEFRLAVVC